MKRQPTGELRPEEVDVLIDGELQWRVWGGVLAQRIAEWEFVHVRFARGYWFEPRRPPQ